MVIATRHPTEFAGTDAEEMQLDPEAFVPGHDTLTPKLAFVTPSGAMDCT